VAEISKTADQALAVLIELSENGPMNAADLSRSLELNRTVVHRLLSTLHQRGFIMRGSAGFTLAPLLVRMADRVQPDLRAAAAPVMRDLARASGETVVLHTADGDEAVVLEQVVGTRHVVRVEHRTGSRHPLTKAASGRALLAFMDEAAISRILKKATGADVLRQQLEGVRQLGYAVSHDELQQGVHGIAVSLRDRQRVVASLAVLVPATRASDVAGHLAALKDAASRIEASCYGHA